MTLTLTADIDAETRYLTVTGTVPDSIEGGYRFRLGDEALELQGFVMPQHTVTVDRNRWYVRRAQDGSAGAIHTTGTEIKGANDAFISATSGTTPPNPFAGGGSGFANPATEDLDMATHAITNLVAGVAASDAATVGQLGSDLGNPQPTLADLGLDVPPMWEAGVSMLSPTALADNYSFAFCQLDGWVLAAEDFGAGYTGPGSGHVTGEEAPDTTGLGVGDALPTDGGYTWYILAAIGDWPPTPTEWATDTDYSAPSWVWPSPANGQLFGPYPGYPTTGGDSTTQPAWAESNFTNTDTMGYVADPATGAYWMLWGQTGVFTNPNGSALVDGRTGLGLIGETVQVVASARTGDTLAATTSSAGDGIATTQSTAWSAADEAQNIIQAKYGSHRQLILTLLINATTARLVLTGYDLLPSADPAVPGDVWLDNKRLAVSGAGAYVTVQTGAPSTYTTPLVYDDTAVTGGLYAWAGMAYVQVGPALP